MKPHQRSTRTNTLWIVAPLLLIVSCLGQEATGTGSGFVSHQFGNSFSDFDLGGSAGPGYWNTTKQQLSEDGVALDLGALPDEIYAIVQYSPDGQRVDDLHLAETPGGASTFGDGDAESYREFIESFGGTWASSSSVSSLGAIRGHLEAMYIDPVGVYFEEFHGFSGQMDPSKSSFSGDYLLELYVYEEGPGTPLSYDYRESGTMTAVASDGTEFFHP